MHTEFVEQLTELMYLADTYQLSKKDNIFCDAIGEGIALGIEANKKHEPVIATRWSDFAWEVLEVAKGIGEGVGLGVYNTVCFAKNVVCHPICTTSEIIHGLGTIVYAVGKAVAVPVKLGAMCVTGNREQAYTEVQKIYEQMKFFMQECATKLAVIPKRNIAKHTTAFATDWVLTGKALTLAHSVCSRAGPLIAEAIELLSKEPSIEYAVAGLPGVSIRNDCVQGMLHHMSETAKQVGGAAKEIIKDTQLLLQSFHAEHMAKLEPEIAYLRTLFDGKIKGFGEFSNKFIKIEYEHILGMDLNFSRRGIPQIGGFHHDLMNIVEKGNLFEFVNKTFGSNGLYKADVLYKGNLVKEITFFPSHWSREKVINKIYEAYSNFIKSGVKAELKKGKYFIKGFTNEGIKMEMYITKNGRMVTAYPKL